MGCGLLAVGGSDVSGCGPFLMALALFIDNLSKLQLLQDSEQRYDSFNYSVDCHLFAQFRSVVFLGLSHPPTLAGGWGGSVRSL
jgi:hypothetical protein